MRTNVIISKTIDLLLLVSAVVLTNATALSITLQFPGVEFWSGYAWVIVLLWLGPLALMFLRLKQQSLLTDFFSAWKRRTFLIFFIVFSLCSLIWSVYFEASLYKVSMLLFSSLMGVYLAIRYDVEYGFRIIRNAAVIFIIASFALLWISAPFSRLLLPSYGGAWRGIFWHRNHLGSLMAFFSALFLFQILNAKGKRLVIVANIIYFLLSVVLVFGSRSAAGMLILFLLNGTLIVGLIWCRFKHLLHKKHDLAILTLGMIAALIVLLNLDFVFGLVGRDTTLTGRTVIWSDLLSRVWPEKPLFGYGFGALWMQDGFRTSMQVRHHWSFQVFFSDNGFLDFLLNVGIVGLAIFLIYFVRVGIDTGKILLKSDRSLSLLLPLTFLYILVANISYSFFLEIDQFVWMLLVMISVWSGMPHQSLD